MSRRLLTALLAATTLLAACGDDASETTPPPTANNNPANNNPANNAVNNNPTNNNPTNNNPTPQPARLCVGVRGNGPRIFAHFAALARIHEHYGLIDGVAGGSSGSITAFLTESIYANPNTFTCGDAPCTDTVAAGRVALQYKSLAAYLDLLSNTEEVQAVQQLLPLVEQVQSSNIGDLLNAERFDEARDALNTLLASPDLASLINPEVIQLLQDSPNLPFHLVELWAMLQNFGAFATDTDAILIRPGAIDFQAFARLVGRIGSFYAAYGPADHDAWQGFLNACAEPSRGLTWPEIAALDPGDGTRCGERFAALLTTWRDAWVLDEPNLHSRAQDPIGLHLPVLVSTSVLTGDAVTTFQQARQDWLDAQPYTLDLDFNDVRFGYWGQQDDLDRVALNPNAYTDDKTARFLPLGEGPWRVALATSPAEPGLARALEIDDDHISAGGWSDLSPAPILKNLGCDKVVLVTTRKNSDEPGFDQSIATLLDASPSQLGALYDFGGDSAVRSAIATADARWCNNWDAFSGFDLPGVYADAWTAPLETTDPFFTQATLPYPNISPDLQLPACSPGVAP